VTWIKHLSIENQTSVTSIGLNHIADIHDKTFKQKAGAHNGVSGADGHKTQIESATTAKTSPDLPKPDLSLQRVSSTRSPIDGVVSIILLPRKYEEYKLHARSRDRESSTVQDAGGSSNDRLRGLGLPDKLGPDRYAR